MYYFDTRQEMMLTLCKPGSKIAEIGVFAGEFATTLAKTQPALLVLIDPWRGILTSGDADGNNVVHIDGERAFQMIKEKAKGVPFVDVRRGYSQDVLPEFPDEFFDVVYIDGDHSFQGCARDLDLALRKVKKGGWICGHDYEMNYTHTLNVYDFGVGSAVDIFCLRNGLRINAKALDGCVSYAIQKVSQTKDLPIEGL